MNGNEEELTPMRCVEGNGARACGTPSTSGEGKGGRTERHDKKRGGLGTRDGGRMGEDEETENERGDRVRVAESFAEFGSYFTTIYFITTPFISLKFSQNIIKFRSWKGR